MPTQMVLSINIKRGSMIQSKLRENVNRQPMMLLHNALMKKERARTIKILSIIKRMK